MQLSTVHSLYKVYAAFLFYTATHARNVILHTQHSQRKSQAISRKIKNMN